MLFSVSAYLTLSRFKLKPSSCTVQPQFVVILFYKVVYLHKNSSNGELFERCCIKRLPRNLTAKNSYDCTTFTEDMRKSIVAPFFSETRCTRRMAIANGKFGSFCNQPKAHFGLPWVRPWDNRGKFHMGEKRFQCLSNASQYVPSIFNRFPVIQAVSSKVRHFSTFLHILAYHWYAPGTIAVNITFNDSMLVKRIAAYPSIFNRLRAMARCWSEIATFFLPPCI